MESKRLSKLSYALSYEINMINHILKPTLLYSCEFEIIKNAEINAEIVRLKNLLFILFY